MAGDNAVDDSDIGDTFSSCISLAFNASISASSSSSFFLSAGVMAEQVVP